MEKVKYLLQGIDLDDAVGIEIGALDKPVVPPSTKGIFYVDYTDTQTLRERYSQDPNVDVNRIVTVHGIWGEKTLSEAAQSITPVDFVIASHVIEHVPDLIAWLQEIAATLKTGGELRLAVPDKRYTFDVLRSESDFADVLSAHLVRARVPQPRQVIDHMVNYAPVDCAKLWADEVDLNALHRYHPISSGEAVAMDVISNGTYHDVHCWVFTPASFINLMEQLAIAGYLPLKCADMTDTCHNNLEFFATVKRCEDKKEILESWAAARNGIIAKKKERSVEEKAFQQRIEELEETIQQLERSKQEALDQVFLSKSWRITAPVRALARWLRR